MMRTLLGFVDDTRHPSSHGQHGVVLIITLIVLVAMTLAGVALLRTVDVVSLVAGNLAFRQSGSAGADTGAGAARVWLMSTTTDLTVDHTPSYFSTWNGGASGAIFDPTTFNWSTYGSSAIQDLAGNQINYVIHRMCENSGDPNSAGTNCISGPTSALASSHGNRNLTLPCPPACGVAVPYYRITARAVGPRNTVTYTQVVLY